MKFLVVGADLFSGTFAILAAMYFMNFPHIKEAKKKILTQQLINKKARKQVTNLKTQKAKLGALLFDLKGALAKVLRFNKGLKSQAGKLQGMKRNKCGDLSQATYRIKDGVDRDHKTVIHNKTGARYTCQSYEKLNREGKLSNGGGGYGGTSSVGR